MEYAAVIIPTLNRIEHLTRCVESLLKNKEAIKTDIYISVDYPPSKRYEKGYMEVLAYVKTITGFLSVNIYYQEKNLGPGLNRKFLEEKISNIHDKYVFTDDDNEFSENFLAYINWGLEKYKDDESIYAICSCSDFDICNENTNSDYFMITAYNPYGAGHWIHKNKKCAGFLNQYSLNQIYKSKERQQILYNNSPMVYMCVAHDSLRMVSPMRGKNDSLTYIDIWENVYLIENNMKCVKPMLPKSRNWGLDGSGIHVSENDKEDYVPEIELDNSKEWANEPIRLDEDGESKNVALHRSKFRINKKEKKRCKQIYFLNYLFGNKILYLFFRIVRTLYRKIFRIEKNEKSEVMYG